MKVIHLFLDEKDFEELKKVKKKENIKSWVDFFKLMKEYQSENKQ